MTKTPVAQISFTQQVFQQIELCKSLQQYSYLSLSKSEQNICKKLSYLLRLVNLESGNQRHVAQFKKCWKYLQELINLSMGSKLVTNFPLLAMGQKQSVKSFCIENIGHSMIEKQRLKNYKDFLEQYIQQDACMSNDEIKKSVQINNLVYKHKLPLLHPTCFGCSSYFQKGRQIQNNNPFYHHLVPLSTKDAMTQGKLEKIVLGMANTGGGIIIVGAQTSKNGIKIEGIEFGESVDKLQKLFYTIECMGQQADQNKNQSESQNYIGSSFDKVLLINEFFVEIPYFCFRIIIEPFTQRYPCFKLKYVPGQAKQIKLYYELKQGKQRQFIDADKNFYTFIHQKHAFGRKNKTKSHGKTACSNKSEEIFLDFSRKFLLSTYKDESQSQVEQDTTQINDIQCPMNYHKHIILIMSYSKCIRFKQEFRNYLSPQELNKYELILPFKQYQQKYQESQTSNLFYLLSHTLKDKRFNEIMSKDKTNNITFMRVHRTIRIDTIHKNRISIQKLNLQIYDKFGEKATCAEKSSSFFIEVNDKRQAIYSYLVCQLQLNTKPIFMKKERGQSKH